MSVLCCDWNVTQDTELLCRDRLQTEGDNRIERDTFQYTYNEIFEQLRLIMNYVKFKYICILTKFSFIQ